jgi:hypothetical protein
LLADCAPGLGHLGLFLRTPSGILAIHGPTSTQFKCISPTSMGALSRRAFPLALTSFGCVYSYRRFAPDTHDYE